MIMTLLTKSIWNIFIVPVVSLLLSGVLISVIIITDKSNQVEYKTEQTSSSTSNLFNEFSTYKQRVQASLANDDYDKIDSYTDKVSNDLKQDTDFKMFVEVGHAKGYFAVGRAIRIQRPKHPHRL